MSVYRFESNGRLLSLDTKSATLLMSTRWAEGKDQPRWNELYQTPRGRYILVEQKLWPGRCDIRELTRRAAVRELFLAEDGQRTKEGDNLLAEFDPCEEA